MGEEFVVSMVFKGNDQMSRPAAQMNRALTDMTRNQKEVTRSQQEMSNSTSRLGGVVKAAFAAFAVSTVKQFAEDFNELGVQVAANRKIFEQLTGVWGDSDRTLQKLRGSTMGVVDDMTLMAGASQLLRLNIVQTEGDLEQLVGQIQRLKQPTESMESAISNFSMMLANESKLRLDSFGISSANVTRRMEELGESFREATMHEMSASIERLGDAADVSDTALNRFNTRLTNISQQGAEAFANVLERGLTALDQLITLAQHDALGALFGQDVAGARQDVALESEAYARGQAIADSMLEGVHDASLAPLRSYIVSVTEAMLASIAEGSGGLLWESQIQELMAQANGGTAPEPGTEFYNSLLGVSDEIYRQLNLQLQAEEVAESQVRLERERFNILMRGSETIRQQAVEQQRVREEAQRTAMLDELQGYGWQLSGLYGQGRGGHGDVMLYTEQELRNAQDLQALVDSTVDKLKEANESDIITDDELADAVQFQREIGATVDEIERGAEAMRNLTLGQAFGQGGGGLMGEVNNMLLGALGERGLGDDAMQAITDALNLGSGVETAASIAMRDNVIPLLEDIYLQYGEEAAVRATRAFSQGIRAATEQGQTLTPEMMMAMTGFQRTGGTGSGIDVQAGDNLYTLASRYGGGIEDYRSLLDANGYLQPGSYGLGGGVGRIPNGMFTTSGFGASQNGAEFADMAASMSQMAADTPAVADGFTGMVTDAAELETHVRSVKDVIGELASGSHKISVDLDVKYPAILDLLLTGGQREALANTTRANGGRTPGADPRGRQIERG